MREDLNPYQSPQAAELLVQQPESRERVLTRFALVGWPFALVANLPIPLMFAIGLTEDAGRWGMLLAILVFLGLGYLVCYYWPSWSRRIVSVSLLLAVTQFVPIIQMFAGIFAIDIAQQIPFVGRFSTDADSPEQISNELAGFVVTLICGTLLCLIVAGLILLFGAISRGTGSKKNQ